MAWYERKSSFEGIYRKMAAKAAKRAAEREALKALTDGDGVPMERHYTKARLWKAKLGRMARGR